MLAQGWVERWLRRGGKVKVGEAVPKGRDGGVKIRVRKML